MGCCASTEAEVEEVGQVPVTQAEAGSTAADEIKVSLNIAETDAVKAKAGNETFIATVLKARAECADNADVLKDCCTRLQAHNRRLKEYVAIYDCQTVNEAMNGGFMGLGCNDNKLIAALCTRTKSQLQRTRKQYREMYDKDLREEVQGETSGSYRKLMFYALAAPDTYVADIIDRACDVALFGPDWGCDETALLEVFVTHTQEQLQAGKDKWEGRTDKSLVDHLNSELGRSYRHLNKLLQLLFMGDRREDDAVEEDVAQQQAEVLHEECEKGWFEDFDESMIITIIGSNTTNQNQMVAKLYEKTYGESLTKALKGKCGDRLHYALNALLLTKTDFIAMRLHDAAKGWFTNKDLLTRLLGGLEGQMMMGVAAAYEQKYDQPLWSALKEMIDGDFLRAALTWIRALEEPSRGAEEFTDVDVDSHGDECEALVKMLDFLLLEHESLLVFVAYLDVESIREACKGYGTKDTPLIRAFGTRNKRSLARVNIGYREAYGEPLQVLIDRELLGEQAVARMMGESRALNQWYAYLAKFLVVQEEQADAMILDIAMDSPEGVDHAALVEFLCARHPKRVRAAKKRWEQQHDDSLVDKLADNLAGDMQRLALRMLKGKRDTDEVGADNVDEGLARKQAHQLHDGGADYIEVLCDNSPQQNMAVSRFFEDSYDMSLRRAISQEYSGPVKNALLALLQGPVEWYAAQLKSALSGEEVDNKKVCRIVGAHDKDEIKQIAAAYDKKYGVTLKSAVTSACKGDYRRLAVAWIDLTDELAQPDKKIDLPKLEADVAQQDDDSAQPTDTGKSFDDEISDEDDVVTSRPDPTSAMYKAKVSLWTKKFNKYKDLGKKRKADHYSRLLVLYPPLPPGHKILKGYMEALEEEYKGGAHQVEDWTMIWLDTVPESEFEDAGTTKDFFKNWLDTTESMVAEKLITVGEMKGHWGLNEPEKPPQATYAEPAPLAGYPTATPVAQPVPMATPAYPQAYPQATPAYPQAAPYGMNYPQPPIYQRPAAYPGAPPMYGGAAPPIYGAPSGMYTPQPMGASVQVNVTYGR